MRRCLECRQCGFGQYRRTDIHRAIHRDAEIKIVFFFSLSSVSPDDLVSMENVNRDRELKRWLFVLFTYAQCLHEGTYCSFGWRKKKLTAKAIESEAIRSMQNRRKAEECCCSAAATWKVALKSEERKTIFLVAPWLSAIQNRRLCVGWQLNKPRAMIGCELTWNWIRIDGQIVIYIYCCSLRRQILRNRLGKISNGFWGKFISILLDQCLCSAVGNTRITHDSSNETMKYEQLTFDIFSHSCSMWKKKIASVTLLWNAWKPNKLKKRKP